MSSYEFFMKRGEVEDKTKGTKISLYKTTGLKTANFASEKPQKLVKSINIRKI